MLDRTQKSDSPEPGGPLSSRWRSGSRPPKPPTRESGAVAAVSYTLSLLFLFAGLAKLWGPQMVAEQFAAWNLPPAFMYLVGVVEVGAGILLMRPSARAIGALLLGILMIGAGVTHFFAQQWVAMAVPGVIFLLLAWILFRSPLPIAESEEHDEARKEASAH